MEPARIDVLDHGYVLLADSMGSDLSIVRAARVSYNADWRTGDNEKNDEKLIGFLWKNHHMTPFESVEFTFEIKIPMFGRSQWHRHRTQSYNELSARYAALPEEFYVPEIGIIGIQDSTNKQGRSITELTKERKDQLEYSIELVAAHHLRSYLLYDRLMNEFHWPRELARSVLGSAFYTRFFAKANLRNWLHFLELRLDQHAQYEIRVYAEAIRTLIRPTIPVTWEMIYGTNS